MNLLGTALEQSDSNHYFVEFKNKNPQAQDISFEFKCWMLHKFFKDHIIIELIKIVIGIILLILPRTGLFNNIGNKSFSTVFLVGTLIIGVILVGTGVVFAFSNFRCLKNLKDYVWDEEGEIVDKIIKFYDRKN